MFFLTTNKVANVLKDEMLVALEMDGQEEMDQKSKEMLLLNKHDEVFIISNNNTRKKSIDVALKQSGKFFKSE